MNMGFTIKATNDPITTQQGEHWYYMQRSRNIIEKIINIAEAIQHEDVPTSANIF